MFLLTSLSGTKKCTNTTKSKKNGRNIGKAIRRSKQKTITPTKKSFIVPAILIAQFSRNFNNKVPSIDGEDLMAIVLNYVHSIQNQVGGLITFLECEPIEKLVEFYKSQGFRLLKDKIISKTDKELLQLYRLI